jgi:sphingomyelin phosphodiesterase acid-like 3
MIEHIIDMPGWHRMADLKIWLLLCLMSVSPTLWALDQTAAMPTFVSFSDIHFNPFANCKTLTLKTCPLVDKLCQAPATGWQKIFESDDSKDVAEYSHDTNYALFKSSLSEIAKVSESSQPRFAIMLGDYLAHNYHAQYILYSHDRTASGYQSFVKKTIEFLTQQIHEVLPTIDIYPALGNNDSYTGDYSVQPGGSFLRDTAATWVSLIGNANNQLSLRSTFPIAGFYAVTLPGKSKQKLIVLDTVLFSTAAKNKAMASAAQLQLQWLRQQLQQAASQKHSVLLAYHIPDGVNVYMTLINIFHGVDEFWQRDYSNAFNQMLKQYATTIKGILPGHIHMDSFQVINFNNNDDVPVSYTPSISPIFGNNPGFKVYSYDADSLQLTNYDMYFYPLNEPLATRSWRKEYSFADAYHPNCVACDLLKGMKQLTPTGDLANNFKRYYAVGTQAQPIIRNHYWLPYYWCDVFDSGMDAYQTCIRH